MKPIDNDKDRVLAELARIRDSPEFSGNDRLTSFLHFVIQQKLEGKAHQLKETVIAIEVFGRNPDYDPRSDPVVRMQAARLRARLAEYYAGAGAHDPIRIEIPKGSYVPQWRARGFLLHGRWWTAALVLAALLGVSVALNVGGVLGKLRGRAPVQQIKSVAVLPFENLSHDPQQEYFADGMTEALITDLGKFAALQVISRNSVMGYKGTGKTTSEIGRELKVDALIEGAVLRSSQRVRITAQLVQVQSEHSLWAETYEGDLGDILVLQDEVAQAVAREVKIKLSPSDWTKFADAHPVDPAAHDAYLRGRYEWNKWTKAALENSISYFEQALRKDPSYAQAWAGLSDTYSLIATFGIWPARIAMPKAKAAAVKALELDATLSEAHVSLAGPAFVLDRSWSVAEKELRLAIALDPSNAMAHQWHGYYLMAEARFDQAIAEMRRALELDPLSGNKHNSLAAALYLAGRYDESLQHDRDVPDPDENSEHRHRRMANAYERKGMQKEALVELLAALRWSGKNDLAELVQQKYRSVGYREAKNSFLRGSVQENLHHRPAFEIASDLASLGQKTEAYEWLDKAVQECDIRLLYLKVDEQWESLRTEPRFQELVRGVGLL